MSHVHTLKDLETELSFIKDKSLLVTCRDLVENGKQLVFRKKGDDFNWKPINMIFIHSDLNLIIEGCDKDTK